MILIFTIHSFSLSDPTTAISFDSFFFSFFYLTCFGLLFPYFHLSLQVQSITKSQYSHIPNLITTVYSKPHHNHTLLLKKSDTLIFLLNFDTLILSLLSPLSQLFSTPRMPLRVYYSM